MSTGGGEFASGLAKDMALGAEALATFAGVVGERCPVLIGLHTDHCTADKLDGYLRPLLAISLERRRRGESPLFNSHMFDGSTLAARREPRDRRRHCSRSASRPTSSSRSSAVSSAARRTASPGEDAPSEKLYTTPEDMLRVAEVLGTGERGRYLLAATFGNVHGVYAPGNVKLRPKVLRRAEGARRRATGRTSPSTSSSTAARAPSRR